MKTNNVLLLVIIALLFSQCKSGTNNRSSAVSLSDTSFVADSNRITYMLPSPDEVLEDIVSDKVKINPQLVNPKENAAKYLDRKSLALNLGVYIADFAYLNLNNNKANALEYFKIIRDFYQKLNIYGIFDENFFARIQNNLMNNDSLSIIANDMYSQMAGTLENSNRMEDYALISTGAFIEALYVSAMSIPNYKNYSVAVKKIFEQNAMLQNYHSFAYQYRKDKDVNDALMQLDSVNLIFSMAEKKSSATIVTRDKPNHLTIKGGNEVSANEAIFARFIKSISASRQHIIKY